MKNRPVQKLGQSARQHFRLQAIRMLSAGEREFARLTARLETDPLFDVLRPWVKRRPLPGRAGLLPPAGSASTASSRTAIDWSANAEVIDIIQRLGEGSFREHFLENVGPAAPHQLALILGIPAADVGRIQSFLLSAAWEAPEPQENSLHAEETRIARIELDDGQPVWYWEVPHLARGRYQIDYDTLKRLREARILSRHVVEQLPKFLGQLEQANMRMDVQGNLSELILKTQRRYLVSGRAAELKVCNPSEAARRLGVHPSTILRSVVGRWILLPQGSERPLVDLLPSKRDVVLGALDEFLDSGGELPRDDKSFQVKIFSLSGISVSRRTANDYRRQIQTKAPR